MTTEKIPNGFSSLQEIGSFVVRNLRKQGKQAMGPSTVGIPEQVCMYRSPDGCKCAAGWLIPDDKYDSGMEERGVKRIPFFLFEFDSNQIGFIYELQKIHDREWDDREEEWENLFESRGLTLEKEPT